MTSISIIARNNCKLNVDVSGNYNVALTGITGPFNIVLLKKDVDYLKIQTMWYKRFIPRTERIKYWQKKIEEYQKAGDSKKSELEYAQKYLAELENTIYDEYVKPTKDVNGFIQEYVKDNDKGYEYYYTKQEWKCFIKNDVITACDASTVIQLINEVFLDCHNIHVDWTNLIDFAGGYTRFKFTHIHILEASSGFRKMLGLNPIEPVEANKIIDDTIIKYSDNIPVYNGTPYIFLKCNKLKSALRYCWQTNPNLPKDAYSRRRAMFANTQSIVSISPNNNLVTQPFNLAGGQFTANGNDLTDVEFTIEDIEGNELEFASDLLWTFELTPLPDEDLSNIPGLFPQDMQPPQEGEEQMDGQMEGQEMEQQQPQEGEQQNGEQMPEQQGEQQQEEIIKPQANGLMRRGFPRVELIE